MGGLRKKLPVIYWTFLIGASSLAALPFITAGFYSKDQILWLALSSDKGNIWFFMAALLGAVITSVYTFRMVFLTFFGEEKTHVGHDVGKAIAIPLVVLAVLSLVGGFIELPHTFGHVTLFSDFLSPLLPLVTMHEGIESSEWLIQGLAAVLGLTGIYVAYIFYLKKPLMADSVKNAMNSIHQLLFSGWGFDWLYDTLFVKPFVWISSLNKNDVVDRMYTFIADTTNFFHGVFSDSQSGILRWYLTGIVIGAIILITIGFLL
jgi:NADH-quinone oxidoreductase subunit L